jgi:hypothetical protein
MLAKQVVFIQNKMVHLTILPYGLNLPYRNKSIRVYDFPGSPPPGVLSSMTTGSHQCC